MQNLVATYVHHIDPFAIQFTENFGIRWYGLSYVAGFLAAYLLIRWFVRLKACELKQPEVADFITIVAIAGVMLGGRLGFMLFYNRQDFFADPLIFFRFHQGGMASHGAIFAIVLVTFLYARYKKISWPGLGDNLVTVAPVGIFFGRIANFVNGELYGRITNSSLAMKFPDELHGTSEQDGQISWDYSTQDLRDFAARCMEVAPDLQVNVENYVTIAAQTGENPHHQIASDIIQASNENEQVRNLLAEILNPRHPSQLYEAAAEGLILFLILLAVRLKWKNAYHGVLTGLFFVLYAIGRIAVENLRHPDSNMIGSLTKGQFYSLFMIAVGIAFLVFGFLKKRQNQARI